MIVCLRLLAAFTILSSFLWLSHLCSMGPEGMRASSFIVSPDKPGQHGDGNRDVSCCNRHRGADGKTSSPRVVLGVIEPERLKDAVNTMVQMKSQRDHGRNINRRD